MKHSSVLSAFIDACAEFEKLDMCVREVEISKVFAGQIAAEMPGPAWPVPEPGLYGEMYGVRLVVRPEPLSPMQRAGDPADELESKQ